MTIISLICLVCFILSLRAEAEKDALFFRSECAYHIGRVANCGNLDSSDCIDCLVSAVDDQDPFKPDAKICQDDPYWGVKKESICTMMRECEANHCGERTCLENLGGLTFCLGNAYRKYCAFCPFLFDHCAEERSSAENCGVQYGDECYRCVEFTFNSVEYMGCEERETVLCSLSDKCKSACGSCHGEMAAYRDCRDHDSSYDYHRDCPNVACGTTSPRDHDSGFKFVHYGTTSPQTQNSGAELKRNRVHQP